MPGTRKLGRPTAHRKAMLRGMVTLLLENGQIETTLTRAKEVRSMAEKMITLGKKNTLASRRAALAYITKEDVVSKLFNEIAPGYAKRNGGYTQIFKLGARRGDAAEMAIVRLIDQDATEEKKAAPAAKKATAKKPAAKKTAAKRKLPPKLHRRLRKLPKPRRLPKRELPAKPLPRRKKRLPRSNAIKKQPTGSEQVRKKRTIEKNSLLW